MLNLHNICHIGIYWMLLSLYRLIYTNYPCIFNIGWIYQKLGNCSRYKNSSIMLFILIIPIPIIYIIIDMCISCMRPLLLIWDLNDKFTAVKNQNLIMLSYLKLYVTYHSHQWKNFTLSKPISCIFNKY